MFPLPYQHQCTSKKQEHVNMKYKSFLTIEKYLNKCTIKGTLIILPTLESSFLDIVAVKLQNEFNRKSSFNSLLN